ncbi:hypothetical protein I4U23_004550 [Adineta vaga]|nr:hypothetical protein I4U23_004550 [Adineta vaga]
MKEIQSVDVNSNIETTFNNQSNGIEMEPTVEELATLEHILDRIPLTVWSIIFCEMCEGFASTGTYQIMQNYIQFPEPTLNNTQAGALDLGQQTATALTLSYSTLCFLSPIAAGIIADQFWGRYRTLVVASVIYVLGLIILVTTSIPASLKNGIGLPGLICGMITMGIATGGFKTASGPLMAEQYTRTKPVIKEIKGKKKIVDPKITIQSLFNWLCCAYSLGTLVSMIILTIVERYHSFWLAYLIPLGIFPASLIVLFITRQRYIRVPPTQSMLVHVFRVTYIALTNRWRLGKQQNKKHWLDYAKETVEMEHRNQFIDDFKETLHACRLFVFFPFFWICYNQISGNLTSQAAQMNTGSIPNDIFGCITPLFVLIFAPIFDKIICPTLRRCNIEFGSVKQITCGFFAAALGIGYTAIVQHLIYSAEPNFNYETEPCLTCQTFNNINVAWQLPSHIFLAISETLTYISGQDYAFTKAPATMKSIVMSVFLATAAVGGVFNIALIPVNIDPKLVWMYTSIAIVTFVIAIIFYILFRKDDVQILPISDLKRRSSVLSIR